jgi:hypothetical protein
MFRSNMQYLCFLKCYQVPSNVIKYDRKSNTRVWLEVYHLACRAGKVDDDLFII